MSGEYYVTEVNDDLKFIEDDNKIETIKIGDWTYSNSSNSSMRVNNGDDCKLHEMGEALEIAENRCHALKGQLDSMKGVYRHNGGMPLEPQRSSYITNDGGEPSGHIPSKHRVLLRQNSGCIGTDTSGSAVITINNILSGITNSINKLTDLNTRMHDDDRRPQTQNKQMGEKYAGAEKKNRVQMKPEASTYHNYPSDMVAVSSTYVYEKQLRTKKSAHHFKESRKKQNRSVISFNSSGSVINVQNKQHPLRKKPSSRDERVSKTTSNTSIKKRKRLKRLSKTSIVRHPTVRQSHYHNNNLVELYHNVAAKSSESDQHVCTDKNNLEGATAVTLLPESNCKTSITSTKMSHQQYHQVERVGMLSPIDERMDVIDTHTAASSITHNYQTPTIASRMKEVARDYFHYRHFFPKAIPFCAAKSTTPSHNIGINIQQVMSIIKTKQPISGISPTLAHNIELAAEKLNHTSLSAMVSTFGTKIGYNFPCPMLSRNNVNYQQLQEMARDIPEEPEEMDVESHADAEGSQENQTQKNPETVWTVDPSTQVNCTCMPQQGVGFQQVLNKYQSYTPQQFMAPPSQYGQKVLRRSNRKYKHIKSVYAQYNDGGRRRIEGADVVTVPVQEDDSIEGSMPLKGKEKVLKGVLVNLHDEFRQISDTHDALAKAAAERDLSSRVDTEKDRELEQIEKKLNDKEEEIQMVMLLYNEVVNLKQQVKSLRDKASMASVMIEQQKQQYQILSQQRVIQQQQQPQVQQQPQQLPSAHWSVQTRCKDITRGTSTAVHLTKLLRQIQAYQEIQKNGGK